ncbi:MAG: T9SS type A sorting domain-containing protein, partial [Omnitrophica WOR_2 bacterium]
GWMIDEITTTAATMSGCSGRNDMLPEDDIKIYPNPFSSYAVLEMKAEFKNAAVHIYNSYGRKVRDINNLSGKEVMIERNNLQPGLYFLNIIQQGKLIGSKRLIILK